MPAKQYIVCLTEDERKSLNKLTAILSFRHSKPFRDLKNILKGDFWGSSLLGMVR